MGRLEGLLPNAAVRGVRPDCLVPGIGATGYGSDAVGLTDKVRVTLGTEAEIASGAPDNVVRVVTRLLQLRYQTNQTCPFYSALRPPSRTEPRRVPGCAALCATWYVSVTLRQDGPTQRASQKGGLSRDLRDRLE